MKAKPKAKRTGKPKAKRAGTTRGAQTAQGANPSAHDTANPSEPVGNGTAQGAANRNGDTRGENSRRAFERGAATLAAMGAASWRRWGEARRVLSYGFEMAIEGAAGYDEILNRPEMLRAVECLINDPPEIAQVFLMPNPNPKQGGAVCDKDCREWILATFQEWFEGFYTFGGELGLRAGGGENWAIGQRDERGVWRWGDLPTMRFYMFPACLNLAVFMLREEWAEFTEKCGLPEFDELRKWLANDRAKNKRYYSRMGDLYDCAYSIEQYFDLNTGESNPPKYGGGGVRATDLLLSFRDYLRARQGVRDCEPVARPNPSAAQGANPSARDTANLSEPVGNGAAVVNITAAAVNVQAATVEMPKPKKQNAGHCGGISQPDFAALLIHYGGKKNGERYTARTVKWWESGETEAPTAGGVKYSADLRRDAIKARVWANNFNTENENAYKARKARV